jgi:hypothetical protein
VPERLNIEQPTLAEDDAESAQSFNTEFFGLERIDGTPVSAFNDDNTLFPLAKSVAFIKNTLGAKSLENASLATPFGASGGALDQFLGFYSISALPPQPAKGTVDFTGESVTVPSGTVITSQQGTLIYSTDVEINFGVTESTITVAVTATEDGADHNLSAGDLLNIGIQPSGLQPTAVWVEVTQAGRNLAGDQEKEELLRARLAQGNGTIPVTSYIQIATLFDSEFGVVFLVPAGVAPGSGPGSVTLYPTDRLPDATEDSAPWTVILPSAGRVDALEAHLQQDDVRAPNDRMFAELLTLTPTTFTLSVLSPNTAASQAAVNDALGRRLLEAYAAGGYTIPNSELNAAIGSADGVESHTLSDVAGGGPAADVVAVAGELATLGVITFP